VPSGEDADVRIVNASVRELYDEMTAAAGERNLWVIGGGNVASQFADEGLLDEVLVTVVPVVLGAGKPLFDRRLPGGPMQLTGTSTFATGMVELRYEIRR
jgi:dihydrofolate reductase